MDKSGTKKQNAKEEVNFLYFYAIWALEFFFCFNEIFCKKRGKNVQYSTLYLAYA